MAPTLLDTDILSEVLKQRNQTVLKHASKYLQLYGQFSLSIFSRFEIARGYREKHAIRQLERFEVFCSHSMVLPLDATIFERAADLWAIARQGGHPHGDADLLIASTALNHRLVLATGNTAHFAWIAGLALADWRQE